MYDVITVGSSTVDVFARTEFSEHIHKGKKDLMAYPIGTKILIKELEFTTGGGATNTAVAFVRLGLKTACLTKTGSGANSQKVISHLEREGVKSLVVREKNGRTGYSIILDSMQHDRTILTFKGSNNCLMYKEIDLSKLKTKWFYFSTMMGQSFKTLKKLAAYAKRNNIRVAFNVSPYLAKKGLNYINPILVHTDIFVLNGEEALLLTKDGHIEHQLKKLKKIVKDVVVITDGRHTFHAYDGGFMYSGNPRKIKVIETTGAGDAFAASFLAGIIKKKDIGFALKVASANAESVIQHHGAKNKLLKYNEVLRLINQHKITKTKI